jgi:hypothetical protein
VIAIKPLGIVNISVDKLLEEIDEPRHEQSRRFPFEDIVSDFNVNFAKLKHFSETENGKVLDLFMILIDRFEQRICLLKIVSGVKVINPFFH